ncbi:unnamed protein product [Lampetra planeri]
MESVPPVSRVAIFGGTHGDEMSGVCLARHWLSDAGEAAAEISRPSFSSTPVLANPRAVQRCTRYIDTDLNRCFTHEQLAVEVKEDTPYETLRAQEINRLFGPKGSDQAFDFIIDMHNTTSNMGNCLIVSNSADILALHMARYMQSKCQPMPCPVLLTEHPVLQYATGRSVAKHSLGLELGPQPQGVARADVLIRMRKLVTTALDFLHLFNTGHEFPAGSLEVCRVTERIDYPRDSHGNLTAVIHPDLQVSTAYTLHCPSSKGGIVTGSHCIQESLYSSLWMEQPFRTRALALLSLPLSMRQPTMRKAWPSGQPSVKCYTSQLFAWMGKPARLTFNCCALSCSALLTIKLHHTYL